MNWVKKRKLPTIKAIQYNRDSCIQLKDLWEVLYNIFNSAQNHQIDTTLLNKVLNKDISSWPSFSKAELINTINKCNNSLTPGLDKLSWSYLKAIIKDREWTNKLINITTTCINLGHWPSYFKMSTIIIPKLNKILYDSIKSFCPIVLLNTTGKLFEKMIGEWLQFLLISNNFVYPCQLGGLKYCSSTDARVVLTHII